MERALVMSHAGDPLGMNELNEMANLQAENEQLWSIVRENELLHAEIERLREDHRDCADTIRKHQQAWKNQHAEIEPLRAVVEAARSMERWDRDVYGNRLWTEMAIALDALDAIQAREDRP